MLLRTLCGWVRHSLNRRLCGCIWKWTFVFTGFIHWATTNAHCSWPVPHHQRCRIILNSPQYWEAKQLQLRWKQAPASHWLHLSWPEHHKASPQKRGWGERGTNESWSSRNFLLVCDVNSGRFWSLTVYLHKNHRFQWPSGRPRLR